VNVAASERVLVVPTAVFHAAGVFHGFCPCVADYLPRLLDPQVLSFRPRSEVESDPTYKQIIPYVVLRCGEQVFHYTRGQKGSEVRLRSLRSIGVGGHISEADVSLFGDLYRSGLMREVEEEVHLDSPYTERSIGLIIDDRTPVGQVHLGIVHVFDLAMPTARRREAVLTRAGFAPLAELRQQADEFETWSQFLLAERDALT
jgi:predicted NUDIX family phosphoesterase